MDGWTPGILQQAVNNCTASDGVINECSILHLYSSSDGTCQKVCHGFFLLFLKKPRLTIEYITQTPDVNEIVLGTLATLPGCNLVSNTTASTLASCPNYVAPSLFTKPVVYTGAVPPPGSQVLSNAAQVVLSYKNYTYVDCYSDTAPSRALPNRLTTASNTVNGCLDAALAGGFKYASVEYYSECYAWNTLNSTSLPVGYGLCGAPCLGNTTQICGGTTGRFRYRFFYISVANSVVSQKIGTMVLYIYNGTFPSTTTTSVAHTSTSTSTTTTISVASGPTAVASSQGYNYVGCYSDKDSTRALPVKLSPTNSSVAACLAIAKSSGYSLAGIEYGGECWSGHYLFNTSVAIAASSCSMPCNSDSTSLCGGPNAISYYQFNGVLPNEPQTVLAYKNWNFQGCYTDSANPRALPNQLTISPVSVNSCLDAASTAGYSMASLTYYGECRAANVLSSTSVPSPNGVRDCQAVCSGNSTQYCGGTNWTIDYYTLSTTVGAASQAKTVKAK